MCNNETQLTEQKLTSNYCNLINVKKYRTANVYFCSKQRTRNFRNAIPSKLAQQLNGKSVIGKKKRNVTSHL